MNRHWPRPETTVWRTVNLRHTLPQAGSPDQHQHQYRIGFQMHSEFNPGAGQGFTKTMSESIQVVDRLLHSLDGDLDVALAPFPPTAEVLACWLLSRLAGYYDRVTIRCYEDYEVSIDRRWITSNWQKAFQTGTYP